MVTRTACLSTSSWMPNGMNLNEYMHDQKQHFYWTSSLGNPRPRQSGLCLYPKLRLFIVANQDKKKDRFIIFLWQKWVLWWIFCHKWSNLAKYMYMHKTCKVRSRSRKNMDVQGFSNEPHSKERQMTFEIILKQISMYSYEYTRHK